jgi:non-specific serine/threonine protein kinase
VPSLTLPDMARLPPLETLTQYEAVGLFVERAQARRADFVLSGGNAGSVAQVCVRLDGMPLAIELAAARVGSLPMETLAARLDDRFRLLTGGPRTAMPRQQTLRATLDWSYDLLSPPEQILLRRLAVSAAGWTLEAAEAVCAGQAVAEAGILDLLSALINKSLVLAVDVEGTARYSLQETVRQYGRERLIAAGEEVEVRNTHQAYFLALAQQAEPRLLGPVEPQWIAVLKREHDNLRAALQWAADCAGVALGLQLAGLLWRFWWAAGFLSEGRAWLDIVLRWDASTAPRQDRIRALQGAGVLACYQGDFTVGIALLEECLSLARTLGDPGLVADALVTLANTIQWRGEQERAAIVLAEALALYRALGDQRGIPDALVNLGIATLLCGDYHRAADLFGESLQLYRGLGNALGSSLALTGLGEAARASGDLEQARNYYSESLALERTLGNKPGIVSQTANLALVACMSGDLDDAEAYGLSALAGAHDLGNRWQTAYSLEALATVACAQGDAARRPTLWQRRGLAGAPRDTAACLRP